jgi:hypothetical protein
MTLPLYTCTRVPRDLALSGKVDDPLWQQAEAVTLVDPVTGGAKRYRTEARLLYSDTHLYIGFTCEDAYVWGTYTERDAPIFSEECVEVFIAPSGKFRQYYELNVSPRNTVFDAFILNGRPLDAGFRKFTSFPDFTCEGLVTLVHVDGELGVPGARGWSAEYAIPFAGIIGSDNLAPVPGEEWRLNLYRIDSEEANQLDLYAWSPPGANDFHIPWQFGVLRFA